MAQVVAEEDHEEEAAAAAVRRLSGLMEEVVVSERQAEGEARPFLVVEEVQRQKPGRS